MTLVSVSVSVCLVSVSVSVSMFPAAFVAAGVPPPYDVAVQQQPLPQHYLQQQSLAGPSTSCQSTSLPQLASIMDHTVQVNDFTNAILHHMEKAAEPSSSGDPMSSTTNAASFIVPLNYGAYPQQASSLMVAPPAASNGPFRTVAVNIDEWTSNEWLESFRHLHISHLGGPDLFQQAWPEYAGLEHAFVEKRNRYINAQAGNILRVLSHPVNLCSTPLISTRNSSTQTALAESLAPHVPHPAWQAIFKCARVEFINSVQRLDRFLWLIQHHALELRAMLDEQKTFNEIFRTLHLPTRKRTQSSSMPLHAY
ncbi:hypothetical protein AAVH_16737 [Aphelenchoides avenae]|nr:hypothetical protein AAVH_16737 [Aphelenchus avenae]